MTPPISGGTDGTAQRRARVVADNIGRFTRGEPLTNVVREPSRGVKRSRVFDPKPGANAKIPTRF